MEFNDTATSQGIVQDVRWLTDTDSTTYPTADVTRNANRWAYRAVTWIIKSDSIWRFDDSNQSGLPIVTATLVDGQQQYSLPTNMIDVKAVSVLDSDGTYRKLRQINRSELIQDDDEYRSSDGLPVEYDLDGDSIYLYPAPAASEVTTSSGLKLYIGREIDVFTASDTTQEPGFMPEPFHRICSLGAAYDWYLKEGPRERAGDIRNEIEQVRGELIEFFGNRNKNYRNGIRPFLKEIRREFE